MRVGEKQIQESVAAVAGGMPGGPTGTGPNRPGGSGGEEELYEKSFTKSTIFTWFLLVVVLMTFGGVISAYVVISTNGVLEWRPFSLPYQVWVSTLIILASSASYIVAEKALGKPDQPATKRWLLVTTVLGAAFVSSQILAWLELVKRGIYVQSNPYAGFFYILTALHAFHVIGGIIALGYVVLITWDTARVDRMIDRCRDIARSVGWYWHFMGGLWLVLLFLLGFWK